MCCCGATCLKKEHHDEPHPENRPRSRRPRLHPRPCHGLGRECKWLHQGHALRSRLRGQRCEYADLPAPAQPRRRASADHGADAPADIEREPLHPLLIPLDASGKRVLGSNGPELALGCRQCPRAGSPSGTGPLFDGPQFYATELQSRLRSGSAFVRDSRARSCEVTEITISLT
jgi:hypothetical protein